MSTTLVRIGDKMNAPIDVEQELANILQEEIWREITAETG
jgi:hypothetical protein